MKRLYQILLKLLTQKAVLYEEFIGLLKTEWSVVTEHALGNLQEILKKKETLVLKMQTLEDNREKVIEEIAEALGLSGEELTLKRLVETDASPYSEKLIQCRNRLLGHIETIQNLNEKNKNLISRSSQSLQKSLSFIYKVDGDTEGSYHSDGKIEGGRMHSRLLNANA